MVGWALAQQRAQRFVNLLNDALRFVVGPRPNLHYMTISTPPDYFTGSVFGSGLFCVAVVWACGFLRLGTAERRCC